MVNVCWQCGDIGFKDALVSCTMCRTTPRHSYCMDELPEDLTAEISWLCEGCRTKPPNAISEARLPKTSPRILGHGSRRATIGPNDPCQGIASANDHLVNSQIQDPNSCVRTDSIVNMDSHVSCDIKNETGCITGGALGTSSCYKLNENRSGESENEKSGKKSLIPHQEDQLNKSHPLVDTLGTKANRCPDNSVEASNMQIVEWTLNRDNDGLAAGGWSAFFGLKVDELQEFLRWKLKGRRTKRRRLILPSKDKLVYFYPVIDGKGTNSFTEKRMPDTVSSSSSFKLNGDKIEECWSENPERKSLILRDKDMVDKLVPPFPLQGTHIQFAAKILPLIPVESLDAIRSSACFELEEAEIGGYGKEKPGSRRLILKTEDDLNCLHPFNDSRGTRFEFTDKKLPDTKKIIGTIDVEDQMKFPFQETFHAEPMVSHVWSGSFNISKVECGPLRAHLSNRACEKVCNCARKLPLILHMQKLPRLVAWPNSFKFSSPTDDNIALYFSPEAVRVESVLDELVDDLINNDLMLKFQFNEVELLVFSSFVLPQDHQRIHGKYYAWGVFKRRYTRVCNVPAGSQAAPNGVAQGYQVDNPSKPARRIKANSHDDTFSKDSGQEINGFISSQSLIQPKEEKVRVIEVENSSFKLEEVGEEKIERNDMASSRGRSKGLRGDVEHQSEPTRPHNVSKFTEAKQDSAALSNSGKVLRNSGRLESEILDSDTKPAAEQQSLLKQPAELEKPGELIQKKWLEMLPDIEEGEVCDDECFKNGESPFLELFPLHVENMGIAFRFGAIKEDNELELGLGLPSFGNHGT